MNEHRLGERLGIAIRIIRKSKGMTLDDVCKNGLSKGNLSKIENGDNNMTVHTLCQIAEALGTTPTLLIEAAL